MAENKLYRTLNLRNEETALSVSISSGLGTVPTDFKALKFAYFDGSPTTPLEWVTLDKLYRDYPTRSGASTPRLFSREVGSFIFGPMSKDGTLKGVYYAKQDPLRTTDPSWYVTNAPELLLYGALLEAKSFIMDDQRLLVWKEFYIDAFAGIQDEESNSTTYKGQLAQRTS